MGASVAGAALAGSGLEADGCSVAIVARASTVTLEDSSFSNGLGSRGAALWAEDSDVTITDCTFTANEVISLYDWGDTCGASGCGASVFASGTGSLEVVDSSFSGDSADIGGSIYAEGLDALTVRGCTFASGEADDEAGAVYALEVEEVTVFDTSFEQTTSADLGAVTLLEVAEAELEAVRFVDNEGLGEGGAIYAEGGTLFYVRKAWFCGNSAGGDAADVTSVDTLATVVYGAAFALSSGDSSIEVTDGGIEVENATFAGPQDAAITGFSNDLTVVNTLFLDQGSYAVALEDGAEIGDGSGYNALWANSGLGWISGGVADELDDDSVEEDPLVVSWDRATSTCDDVSLYLTQTSPLRDAGDPSVTDPDGSSSDIGAYGGEYADLEDADGDGWYTDLDCDDTDEDINPDATEIPDDDIDQDCDGEDETTETESDTDDTETDTDSDTDTDPPSDTDTDPPETDDTDPGSETDTDTGGGDDCEGCSGGGTSGALWMLGLAVLARRRR